MKLGVRGANRLSHQGPFTNLNIKIDKPISKHNYCETS